MSFFGKFRKKRKAEKIKAQPDEWEILCNDSRYFQGLSPEEQKNLQNIQKNLYNELMRLPFEEVLNERKNIEELLKEAEKLERDKKYMEAAGRYRKAATLSLFRKEIREKVDPNATDVSLKDAVVYLKKAEKLGYPLSYPTIIQYPQIAREIASDKLKTYQSKIAEKKTS